MCEKKHSLRKNEKSNIQYSDAKLAKNLTVLKI